ncbi:hypothetical protein QMO56_04370 [Roseomonas sp. E05]|nr:hypothetical protein [Roseomonas sp. E05]MDJ0387341.1 hypothetical protein [Roseomonas sp. E05]
MLDLALDRAQLLLEGGALRARAGKLRLPKIAEHLEGQIEQPLRRAKLMEQRLELALNHIPANGFAAFDAAPRIAQIIRVASAPPLRPAGRQRLAAMAAGHKPPQRKILGQIDPRRHLRRHAEAPLLDRLPGGEANQRLMLGRHQAKAPFFMGDMGSRHRTEAGITLSGTEREHQAASATV